VHRPGCRVECRRVDHGDASLACGDHGHFGETLGVSKAGKEGERGKTDNIVADSKPDFPERRGESGQFVSGG